MDERTTGKTPATPGSAPAPGAPERTSAWSRTSEADPAQGTTTPFAPVPEGTPRAPSLLDAFEPEAHARRWPRRLLLVGLVVIVLGGAYVGTSWALAGRVPRGAEVAGVDIGGLEAAAAVRALEDGLAVRAVGPVVVEAEAVRTDLDPTAAGLTFDAAASVEQLTGLDLARPQNLWHHLVGVGRTEPVTRVDDAALAAAVEALTGPLAQRPVDATVLFVDGSARSTPAATGWALDVEAARAAIAQDWLDGTQPLALPTQVAEPTIDDATAEAALADVARPLTSAPVSVAVADRLAVLDPATLAAAARMTAQDASLVLALDGDALAAAVLAQVPDLLRAPDDARFEFVDDRPVVVPGTPGTQIDPESLAAAVVAASTAQDRTATVELVETDPAQSAAALEALGVTTVVSEFDTPLTSEPRRTANITNGASKITGTLVRPGETFSLTEALGPVDAAHGFVEAGAIIDGEHVDAQGGGLSQVSTTVYNVAYLAGMVDVEHRPHSEWFARYPEGREATIFIPTLDMRWRNDTPHGVLVQAWVGGGRMHARLWSTPYWTVESSTSGRSRVVQPTTVYSPSQTCVAQPAGNPGFTVSVTRTRSAADRAPETQRWTTSYKPQNRIVCGPDPADVPATTDPSAAPTG